MLLAQLLILFPRAPGYDLFVLRSALSRFIFSFSWLVVILLSFPDEVSASSDQERAAARSAAKDGILAYRAGDYPEALELLQRAESLVHAPPHLLFIARCQAQLGMLVESRETYQRVITENLSATAPKAFLDAQVQASAELPDLEARLGQLRLEVVEEEGLENLSILLDGEPYSLSMLGLEVPVNPGQHRLVISAQGMLSQEKLIEVMEGEELIVSVILRNDSEYQSVPVNSLREEGAKQEGFREEPDFQEQQSLRKRHQTWGWVAVGSSAALIGSGVALELVGFSKKNSTANNPDLCDSQNQCNEDGLEAIRQGKTTALVGDILVGTGVIAAGVGTWLLLSTPKKPSQVGVHRLQPVIGKRGFYLGVDGHF
ncbi:MAG: hypothetical protein MK135_00830 [Polyangiaceae bacterium]|nr:hypothetical protein [Polyangiaceae bacterium]